MQALCVTLDGMEKAVAVLQGHCGMAVDQRFHVAFHDTQGRAQLMGDIRDEILADSLEHFLFGDVVQDEQRPRTRIGAERLHQSSRHFEPHGGAALDELELLAGFGVTAPDRTHIVEERDAVQHGFEPLF